MTRTALSKYFLGKPYEKSSRMRAIWVEVIARARKKRRALLEICTVQRVLIPPKKK